MPADGGGQLPGGRDRHRGILAPGGIPPAIGVDYPRRVSRAFDDGMRTLLEAPSAAVLTTYRKDGSALVSPVWFRWTGEAFEVVIANDDVKLRHLARDPRCVFTVFETERPFRGIEVRDRAELVECDVTDARLAIASRYLGAESGERFVGARAAKPGTLLRIDPAECRAWDLSGILPD